MRMLYWPLRSPFSASKRFPGKAARSARPCAASRRSSLSLAGRSIPENAFEAFARGEVSRALIAVADNHWLDYATSLLVMSHVTAGSPGQRTRRGAHAVVTCDGP